MAGIYIHIPFCKRKCIYCDFYSVGYTENVISDYSLALCQEIALRASETDDEIVTLYFGGGTPSIVPLDYLENIFRQLKISFGKKFNPEEITIEVNPDDVSAEKAYEWRKLGFNRISMGVQSFVDSELKSVWRRHNAEQAVNAFHILRKAEFSNISIDLIYAIPGQTQDSLDYSLSRLFGLKPEHISIYCLMYEEHTPLTHLRDIGKITETDEKGVEEMTHLIINRLRENNYNRYEISNFSLNNYESKHNSSYWQGDAYIGFGPGAHSYDGNRTRRFNPPEQKKYIQHFLQYNIKPFYQEEILNDEEIFEEYIITRMRTVAGINITDLRKRFGNKISNRLLTNAKSHITTGNLIYENNHLRFSEDGFLISNTIMVDLSL